MSKRPLYIVAKTVLAVFGLSALMACSAVVDGEDVVKERETDSSNTFINLTIAVTDGVSSQTRGVDDKPTAGENGDGREAGFLRENAVTGITLILYRDDNGINGSDATTLDLVKYYTVSRTGTPLTADGTDLGKSKVVEAYYTTGNQPLRKDEVNYSAAYHAIVIANADLRGEVSTLGDVRAYKMNQLYSGNETSPAMSCGNFVMSSESDYSMNFATSTPTPYNNGLLYTFDNLLIERMAARIDFWSAGSNGYKSTYSTPGYEYSVDGTSDKFVVTGIMPFNLNGGNATNGGEYIIKRLAGAIAATPTFTYLADETGSNYVVDPATINKTDGTLTYMKNTLTTLQGEGTLADITSLSSNTYYKSISNLHTAVNATESSAGYPTLIEGSLSGENAIIAYPMENTLWGASRLYNYATGIAIEGDYYYNGTGTPEHRIFYGYMRHNGTSASAYAAMLGADLSNTETSTSANCMEFGVVRNNIYRIYISKINSINNMTIKIKVKKWDKFEHEVIYM